jgi:thiamine-phosphate pyrophosphorylase
MTPRIVQISALDVVPLEEIAARIARASSAPERFWVQLRDPELDGRRLFEVGLELRRLTRAAGCRLMVNDRLDVAALVEADGVHLGRRSVAVADARRLLGAGVWVSASAHDDAELDRAAAEGADAVLLSPIFASPGKGPPLGLEALERARKRLPRAIELVALGGVTAESAAGCLAAGADGLASIRADLTTLLR